MPNRKKTKHAAWAALCASEGHISYPIASECTGRPCENTLALFETAAGRAGGSAGEQAAFTTYWRQRLGIVAIKGVAETILNNMPHCTCSHYAYNQSRYTNINFAPVPGPTAANRHRTPATRLSPRPTPTTGTGGAVPAPQPTTPTAPATTAAVATAVVAAAAPPTAANHCPTPRVPDPTALLAMAAAAAAAPITAPDHSPTAPQPMGPTAAIAAAGLANTAPQPTPKNTGRETPTATDRARE